MKKGLMVFLLLASLIAALAVVVLRAPGVEKDEAGDEASNFAKKAASEMTESWDHAVLLKYASPELRAAVPEMALKELFERSREGLGRVQRYNSCEGSVTIKGLSGGRVITGEYTVSYRFEKGDAGIKLELVKRDENWFVNRLYVVAAGGI